jgi:hypothetical protein
LLSTRWKKAPLVLIKANVCRLLEPELEADGFKVLNGGRIVPFPGYGHQNNFGVKFREIVGSSNYWGAEDVGQTISAQRVVGGGGKALTSARRP